MTEFKTGDPVKVYSDYTLQYHTGYTMVIDIPRHDICVVTHRDYPNQPEVVSRERVKLYKKGTTMHLYDVEDEHNVTDEMATRLKGVAKSNYKENGWGYVYIDPYSGEEESGYKSAYSHFDGCFEDNSIWVIFGSRTKNKLVWDCSWEFNEVVDNE